MDQLIGLLSLVVIAVFLSAIVLPIVALVISVRSRKKLNDTISRLEAAQSPIAGGPQQPVSEVSLPPQVHQLYARVERLEVTLAAHSIFPGTVGERKGPDIEDRKAGPETVQTPSTASRQPQGPGLPEVSPSIPEETQAAITPIDASVRPSHTHRADHIESMIGRRLVGWAAVALILFATAFFLKYAFDNRWIGELGRVASGVGAGVIMVVLGFKYYRYRWRIFSQILTAGGIVLLYLSAYAAFGYYHLATQKTAFVYLALLVAEAAGLAYLYDAPAIAIMALVGGFLAPILLRSDRDQYRSLFGYIAALDIGALALLKHWRGLSSLAFAGTHLLFWLWYVDNYHPRKRGAVMVFQAGVFLIFLLAHLGRKLVRLQPATFEDLGLLLVNPFVFFATAYHLLNADYHDWMGVFAIGMAVLYAGAAKMVLNRSVPGRADVLVMIGVALTFVTIAMPIQLRSNWITIAWSVEALAILWAGIEIKTWQLRARG